MRVGRRTQVVKGAVCKTAMQRFDPARRLQTSLVHGLVHLVSLIYLVNEISRRGVWPVRWEDRNMKLHVVVEEDEAGYYAAEVPALPGCLSQGKTREEAIANVKQAVEGWLEVMEAKQSVAGRRTIEVVV